MSDNLDKKALEYHASAPAGKVEVVSSKECDTEYALSLAYSPGVAAPCMEIAKDASNAYKYTAKGNLVAVVTNGTAVLGLGNIGPLAGKPVMEGKGVLFKKFANIDVFDIEVQAKTAEEFISSVRAISPTFGGINLEDIAAPDCFVIEETLKKQLNIPVFHDDQHGTAIITAAALINACLLTKKKLKSIKVVFNGAGAASIACARLFKSLGVQSKNITMCDSRGVIYADRKEGMNQYKEEFAGNSKARTLTEALNGADVFCGLSVAGVVTPEMLTSMAKSPVVFAMANPDPEITPPLARKTRPDVMIATGRSDFPNQVNNVLGFPSIFRGALDVQATDINEEMKLAAVHSLAELARQDVPESVSAAYDNKAFSFGPDYIIPKPFDPRVLMTVAPAVAKAAMDTGVAKNPIKNFKAYREELEALQGVSRSFVRTVINKVRSNARKSKEEVPTLIFPEGKSRKVLKALNELAGEKVMKPVLLGYEAVIKKQIEEMDLDNLNDVPIFRPSAHPKFDTYAESFYQLRQRKGTLKAEAERLMADPYFFSAMAVRLGDADAVVSGAIQNYADCVKPILEIIGTGKRNVASGMNIMLFEDRIIIVADTTMNIDPSADELCTIALHASKVAKYFNIEPRIAMLSFSNFTGRLKTPRKMEAAAEMLRELDSNLIVDGEMQADTAVNPEIIERIFPFCNIKGGANILIFPNLDAGNISYKLVQQLSEGEVIGPFLMGVNKPANVMQRTCSVNDIINSVVLTALEAQAFKAQQ